MAGAMAAAVTPPRAQGESPGMSAGGVGGTSPTAKRPARIDPDLTPSGMVMDLPEASEAIYALQRQLKQMKAWGVDVNAGLTNHADLLDRSRDRGDGLQVSIGVNVQKMNDAIHSRVATVESDIRRFTMRTRQQTRTSGASSMH